MLHSFGKQKQLRKGKARKKGANTIQKIASVRDYWILFARNILKYYICDDKCREIRSLKKNKKQF